MLESFANLTGPGESTLARHRFAIFLITVSSIGFSFNGLIVRIIQQGDVWQINLYRSAMLVAVLVGILGAQYGAGLGNAFRRIGRLGFAAGLLQGVSPMLFLLAMTTTTVANALFMLATVPFWTALFARVVLGERVRIGTRVAIAVAAAGIAVMIGEGFVLGSLFGNLVALSAALVFSAFAVIVRKKRDVDMTPTLVIGGCSTCVYCLALTYANLWIGWHDLALCVVWGVVISGFLGNWLFVKAARHLAAAEVTLLMMTEFVLGPVWVWLFIAEVPSAHTMMGGALVLGAVVGRAVADLRGDHRGP